MKTNYYAKSIDCFSHQKTKLTLSDSRGSPILAVNQYRPKYNELNYQSYIEDPVLTHK